MKPSEVLDRNIQSKQKIARSIFRKMYKPKERKAKSNLLDEALYQIEVCEELFKPVTEKDLEDWLSSENLAQVSIKAKTHKFA